MTISEVREKYLAFFKNQEHAEIPSASLVPENDPTTLFIGSGMQPLLPYLLGEKHPRGTRLVNAQKCFRAEDMEEVGDNRHTTFFEMLGNWSLGDYWKDEQLPWFFEFLTKELGIKKERLWATYFEGDKTLGIPSDEESRDIWINLGIPAEHIRAYGSKKNWWSRSGTPDQMPVGEPGGPDSEVFFDFDPDGKRGIHESSVWKNESCHPNCDCGRFMEIGNSVFMEYRKTANGFKKLPQRNVDFGGGLERITSAANDDPDVFKLDVFAEEITRLEQGSGKYYASNPRVFRIILDHTRAAKELMAAGVAPSNLGQGYIVRRLIRRVMVEEYKLGVTVGKYFEEERVKFSGVLVSGVQDTTRVILESPDIVDGATAFRLSASEGVPRNVIEDIAKKHGKKVDWDAYEREKEEHRIISRAGAEKKFKGGLADTSKMSVKYHTATHLLHQALRDVLGSEVRQKGSNITPERLRFDFAFMRKMTEEEKKKVEEIVNEKIKADMPVQKITLPLAEAKASGALHFFDEKYPEEVLVHYIGDSLEGAYSKEFCGGPHVARTGILGIFKLQKEEAVSAGVRRIRAVLV